MGDSCTQEYAGGHKPLPPPTAEGQWVLVNHYAHKVLLFESKVMLLKTINDALDMTPYLVDSMSLEAFQLGKRLEITTKKTVKAVEIKDSLAGD